MMLGATDRAALTDLVHRYAAGVDDRQFDSVTALFTDSAELMLPESPAALDPVHRHCGHAAIRTAIAAVAATIRTEHAIVGEVFDVGAQPDSARGRIACVAHHWDRHGDQLTDVVWHLRYDDEYLRTDAGWRIAHRTLTINAIETRPVRRVRSEGPSE
ncbi:nuclear transport factor 2 family protein [Mycobacterium sp.]|uniref:nuclear transport factor 2 family protein n=1 Tax=Mycobacterium sp. TaxID=1785 RepID=UPI002CF30321|nr:nuclear transport factor 2 family protein [Mycobacterium sp.]HXB87191.1 nuclear transport factor 2 family protein [Mycobacterium sp.]